MNDPLFFLQNLGFALLLGMLIGTEREKRSQKSMQSAFGGIRTMSLVGMLGFLVQNLFAEDVVMFSLFSAAFLMLIVAAYAISSIVGKHYGATSEIAAFFVYLSGVMVGMGENLLATVTTLLVLMLLYFKDPLHSFAKKIETEEFYDTIKFIVVVFVVLPILPNATFGPLDVLNPYTIWFVVVLVSSISFVSYVAIKLMGPKKGIGLGGFLGGLVSSTAVSMSFSQLSKKSKTVVNPFVFGVIIASSAMFFRVLLEVAVLNPDLLNTLLVPMVSMGVTALLIALSYWFKKGTQKATYTEKELNLKSPFQFWPALQFGLFFAALIFISKYASIQLGDQGLYLTAFLSGFVDVDAITVSMANLSANGDISYFAATTAITIATVTNTLVKGLIVLGFGSREVGIRTLSSLILVILIGILSLLFFSPQLNGFASILHGSAW